MSGSDVPSFKITEMIDLIRKNQEIKTVQKMTYVISCRIRGKGLFFWNDREYVANVGDVIYIPYGLTYSQSSKDEEIICFHLETQCDINKGLLKFKTDKPEEMRQLFIEAYSVWNNKPSNYQFICLSILYQIFALCNADFSNSDKPDCKFLQPAVDYINTNLCSPDFLIAEIYKQTGVSQTYFNRTFREFFGCTPSFYASKKRIEKAKRLLNIGGYTNEEISELCGFSEVKYFYVVFKRITGLTTGQYLKQSKEAEI